MRRPLIALAATTSLLAVSACGLATESQSAEGGSSDSDAYPVTVENCGAEVTFDAEPERVVLLKSAAVPYLSALGVLDRVTARAGEYPATTTTTPPGPRWRTSPPSPARRTPPGTC
ncbi:hypothetical protein [Nocardioides humi]|uniref:hypothetical protein n=1 Tax=Nocardioides humi TaxID=449461 RepID=UPI001C63C806|nr:hypothetical protein [Nocardioides humi]